MSGNLFGVSDTHFLTENKGQWHPAVHFKGHIPGGQLYIDEEGFTYQLFDSEALRAVHENKDGKLFSDVAGHVVKARFLGANSATTFAKKDSSVAYQNFFIGNEPNRWASKVRSYASITRHSLYNGVDLRVYQNNGVLKYDVLVAPNTETSVVSIQYDGPDSLRLNHGQLYVYTSVGNFIEQPPFAYQMNGNRLERVACHYQLEGSNLSFSFPEGYDTSRPLVIDPEISFSSYVGSSQSSFGYTATYDEEGHLYAGAISFGSGYPTTAGAFDGTHNGGVIDVAISKFSPDGTQLIYSTFLGGSGNESPHSLVVNNNNELFVMGSTGSANYPTTGGVVQPIFNSGNSLSFNFGYGFLHANGTDIFVTKLNVDGTDLLASTFMGGSGPDGINSSSQIEYNYGDAFRGEIIVNEAGSVVVASTTKSTDFPTTPNAFQPNFGGGSTDGCVFMLNADLSVIEWSTYWGGSGADACFSVQFGDDGSIYATGATRSVNLPVPQTAHLPTLQGDVDGFVLRLSPNAQNLLGATYVGTPEFDESFFVQLDTEGAVFVVGQTEGVFPVTTGTYSNANSGQFIQKFDPNLTDALLSTVVGNGNGGPNISISAFLVSNCNQIYISGWGGQTNQTAANIMTSTTNGLPITADAFQTTTDGSDFYLLVLGPDADEMVYATYFGGSSSKEHVDGGTSRFDKNGIVYQSACAGCGGHDDFPTQPGVWSQTNQSSLAYGQCNMGVFKFDLTAIQAQIGIDGPDEVCAGNTVSFINYTTVANEFEWDFGDESTANATNPSHVYEEPGEYTVILYATHDNGCIDPDSTSIQITVIPPPEINVSPGITICAGDSTELFVEGGDTYSWSPAGQVSDTSSDTPIIWADQETTFYVSTETACGSAVDTVTVAVFEEEYGTGENQTICLGESVALSASGGVAYSWSPASSLTGANTASPTASPEISTQYTVEITSPNGCLYTASMVVDVLEGIPDAVTSDNAAICDGGSVMIYAAGGDEYIWDPIPGLDAYDVPNPIANPTANTWYFVSVINICGVSRDSVLVNIGTVNPSVELPDTVCPGEPISLHASGGAYYQWQPQSYLNDAGIASPTASPPHSLNYTVTITDEFGCAGIETVTVPVFLPPYVKASRDRVIDYYTWVSISAESNGTVSWESDLPLSCTDCPSPTVQGVENGVVYVTSIDDNGCTATDSLLIQVIGTLYVPNAITPNGDGINDIFKAVGTEIESFHLQIFDRWGELIFESFDIDEGWNGGLGKYYVESEVYVWNIVAKEHTGVSFERRGHVTVIR